MSLRFLSFFFILLPVSFNPLVASQPMLHKAFLNQTLFYLEIAQTPVQRAKGLMNRQELPKDRGMLFIFEQPGIHRFWMKNTFIPLDILWLDEQLTIRFISPNVQPSSQWPYNTITPPCIAKYVLELPGGSTQQHPIQPGDQLNLTEDTLVMDNFLSTP